MPKYIFYCVDCKETYEIEKSYSDTSPFKCPEGHTKRLVRKYTVPAVKYVGKDFTLSNDE